MTYSLISSFPPPLSPPFPPTPPSPPHIYSHTLTQTHSHTRTTLTFWSILTPTLVIDDLQHEDRGYGYHQRRQFTTSYRTSCHQGWVHTSINPLTSSTSSVPPSTSLHFASTSPPPRLYPLLLPFTPSYSPLLSLHLVYQLVIIPDPQLSPPSTFNPPSLWAYLSRKLTKCIPLLAPLYLYPSLMTPLSPSVLSISWSPSKKTTTTTTTTTITTTTAALLHKRKHRTTITQKLRKIRNAMKISFTNKKRTTLMMIVCSLIFVGIKLMTTMKTMIMIIMMITEVMQLLVLLLLFCCCVLI